MQRITTFINENADGIKTACDVTEAGAWLCLIGLNYYQGSIASTLLATALGSVNAYRNGELTTASLCKRKDQVSTGINYVSSLWSKPASPEAVAIVAAQENNSPQKAYRRNARSK